MNPRIERRGWIASLLGLRSADERAPLRTGDGTTARRSWPPPVLNPLDIAPSDGEFEATVDETRNWPVSHDEVPEWRLNDEWIAKARGYVLPNYRTRREYDAMVAACESALQAAPPTVRPVLPAHDAAREFLAWLRETGHTGLLANETLSAYYVECCTALNRAPAADNTLREALKRLPGVSKSQPNLKSQNGRRHRPIFWTIAPSVSRVSQETQALAMAA